MHAVLCSAVHIWPLKWDLSTPLYHYFAMLRCGLAEVDKNIICDWQLEEALVAAKRTQ